MSPRRLACRIPQGELRLDDLLRPPSAGLRPALGEFSQVSMRSGSAGRMEDFDWRNYVILCLNIYVDNDKVIRAITANGHKSGIKCPSPVPSR